MAKKNQNTNTVTATENIVENLIPVDTEKDVLFRDVDGNFVMIDYSDVHDLEKKIRNDLFKTFCENTSFSEACKTGKWNSPYIGMHEADDTSEGREYLTVFYRETGINFKRFVSGKYSNEELKVLNDRFKKEIRICNAFLNHIAVDKEKVDVSDVKSALNNLNDSELHINLTCVDDNDNEYKLTCTNKMVRVKLVNDAKENADISGFKRVKIVDMISVIVSGLSKVYNARNDK